MRFNKKFIIAIICIIFGTNSYALQMSEINKILSAHNAIRAEHGLVELKWSDDLSENATQWVGKLASERGCKMAHSYISGLGENLFWSSPLVYTQSRREIANVNPLDVVNAWAAEKKYYSLGSNRCSFGQVCGHYTQLIWRDTVKVGCAKAICDDKSQVWSCNYSPPGNYVGQKPY